MSRIIFHGVRIDNDPRRGRDAALWLVTRAARYWPEGIAWDACFDLHSAEPMGLWPGLKATRESTLDWYRQEPADGRPIYMIEPLPDVPASRAYPLEIAMMGHAFSEDGTDVLTGCKMFGCTLDYLFALALCQNPQPTEIILNGIGMSDDAGHHYVHRTILYWIGIARGSGVAVTIDDPTIPMPAGYVDHSCYSNKRPLYGYEAYGYEDLDAILKFFGPTIPDDDPDLAALRALAADWRIKARSGPLFYADELEHLLTSLQRRARLAEDR